MLTDTDSTKSTINSKARAKNPAAGTFVSTSSALATVVLQIGGVVISW